MAEQKLHPLLRHWERVGIPAVLVEPEDFMTFKKAARTLRRVTVRPLVLRGIIDPAYLADGTPGVTKESVMRDLEWKTNTGLPRRLWRRFTGVIRWF